MADGASKPIETVEVGDVVLGRDGTANRVLEMERPILGDRPLYALNGGPAFVTGGHPFWTTNGWKAVDATAAVVEVPLLRVGQLAIGDRLTNLAALATPALAGRGIAAAPLDIQLEAIVLQTVVGYKTAPETHLYNLRLDGDHSYFANDWLVHNKGF
jgi:hypothetical protein